METLEKQILWNGERKNLNLRDKKKISRHGRAFDTWNMNILAVESLERAYSKGNKLHAGRDLVSTALASRFVSSVVGLQLISLRKWFGWISLVPICS